MSALQAILFDKQYYNIKMVQDFLKKHNLKPIKTLRETKKYFRARIHKPDIFKRLRIVKPNKFTHFIIGFY